MLKLLKKSVKDLYHQYELVTCIYMFEPWEKKLINGFVLLIMCLVIFSSCVYLPTYIRTCLQFLSPLPPNPKAQYAPILQSEKSSPS